MTLIPDGAGKREKELMDMKNFNACGPSGRGREIPDPFQKAGNGWPGVLRDMQVRYRPRQGGLLRVDFDDRGPLFLGQPRNVARGGHLRGGADHEEDGTAFRLGFSLLLRGPGNRLPEQDKVRLENPAALAPGGDAVPDLLPGRITVPAGKADQFPGAPLELDHSPCPRR